MPTTASADFSQFVVTTANDTACETSRDKPANLSSSTCLIYAHGLRLPFGLHCLGPVYPPCTPCIRFLFVRLRFRYPFFSPTPRDVNLGSRYGVRWQLRPLWTFTTDRRHARHTQKKPSLRMAFNYALYSAILSRDFSNSQPSAAFVISAPTALNFSSNSS